MLNQEKIINAVKNKGNSDSRMGAILMYGSFTQGCGDEYSDVEFYLFVKDDDIPSFDTEKWIEEIHPIFNHFYDEYGTEVVIFTNLVRGEFHFMPLSKIDIIDKLIVAGYFPDVQSMVLCDKYEKLQTVIRALVENKVEYGKADAENIVNNLFSNILGGINMYKRGEIARSMESLYFAHGYFLKAVRLLEGKTEHWLDPRKNLENEISQTWYSAFMSCTSSLDKDSIVKAYSNMVDNFRPMISDLSDIYGINSHKELFEKLEERLMSM